MPIPREKRLRAEYVKQRLPREHVRLDASLGMPPESLIYEFGLGKALRMARPSRPMVDIRVIKPDVLELIEFKISRWLDGLSHLLVYKAMVQFTPELEQYQALPIRMLLVIPFIQDNILMTGSALGVEVEEFTTPEVTDYINNTLARYGRSEYKQKRAERKRVLDMLGLE